MITVNKRLNEWYEGMTVQSLLQDKKYTFPRIIIKINGKLIPKNDYSTCYIQDEDRIDAIHLISGG